MGYVPRQWYTEDKITKEALNHIEDGIVDAHTEINYTEQEVADLKFLGWTVPREMPIKNYVDGDGKFHQRVARVDLGGLDWYQGSGYFGAFLTGTANYGQCYSSKYYPRVSGTHEIYLASTGNMVIIDTSVSSVAELRASLQGQWAYYELATEVVIAEGGEVSGRIESLTLANSVKAYKCNNVVTVSIGFTGSVPNSGVVLDTLPNGYRPQAELYAPCVCGASLNSIGYLSVANNGRITVACNPSASYAFGTITFCV